MISSIIDVVLLSALAATSVSVLLMYRRLRRFDVLQGEAAHAFARTADALDKARSAFGALQSDGDHMTVALSAKLNEARLLLNDLDDTIARGARASCDAKARGMGEATLQTAPSSSVAPVAEPTLAHASGTITPPNAKHNTGPAASAQADASLAARLRTAAWGDSASEAVGGVPTGGSASPQGPVPAPVTPPSPGGGMAPPPAPPVQAPTPAPLQASTAVRAARAKLCGTQSGPAWAAAVQPASARRNPAVRSVDWTVLADSARPSG